MNSTLKSIFAGIAVLLAIAATGWFFLANDTAQHKVFGPMREDIRRETFERSKAFRDGMVQELRAAQFDYIKAAPEHKAALAQVIRHKAVSIDETTLPQDLRDFLRELNSPVAQ